MSRLSTIGTTVLVRLEQKEEGLAVGDVQACKRARSCMLGGVIPIFGG
jgi:hypothetical protein